jgi:hypothetical protein
VYTSLLAAVSEVEHALSDVHDLLRTRSGNQEWQREWTEIVQDVLRKDSGWELSPFVLNLLFPRYSLTGGGECAQLDYILEDGMYEYGTAQGPSVGMSCHI